MYGAYDDPIMVTDNEECVLNYVAPFENMYEKNNALYFYYRFP